MLCLHLLLTSEKSILCNLNVGNGYNFLALINLDDATFSGCLAWVSLTRTDQLLGYVANYCVAVMTV